MMVIQAPLAIGEWFEGARLSVTVFSGFPHVAAAGEYCPPGSSLIRSIHAVPGGASPGSRKKPTSSCEPGVPFRKCATGASNAVRLKKTIMDYWGTSAAWRIRRMGTSPAGGALGCSARLRADRCHACGGRTIFPRAELDVASGGAEYGPAARNTVSRGGLRGRWPVPAGYPRG